MASDTEKIKRETFTQAALAKLGHTIDSQAGLGGSIVPDSTNPDFIPYSY